MLGVDANVTLARAQLNLYVVSTAIIISLSYSHSPPAIWSSVSMTGGS